MHALQQYLSTLTIPPQYPSKPALFIKRAHEFIQDNGKLYKLATKGQPFRQVVTIPAEIESIFHTVHDERGHMKLTNACNVINTTYCIPDLWKLLAQYQQSCELCQKFDFKPI